MCTRDKLTPDLSQISQLIAVPHPTRKTHFDIPWSLSGTTTNKQVGLQNFGAKGRQKCKTNDSGKQKISLVTKLTGCHGPKFSEVQPVLSKGQLHAQITDTRQKTHQCFPRRQSHTPLDTLCEQHTSNARIGTSREKKASG